MTTRLLHVSDLHVGAHEDLEVAAALGQFVEQVGPQLVVASGDLSHRGRRGQLEQAAEFLRGLGPPVLAVPGNHDLPHTPARFVRPWAEFERVWETTEPVASVPGLHVVGMNSARPFHHQGGAVDTSQLERACARLEEAEAGAARVVVLHHHLANSPWRAAHKRPLSSRRHVLHTLVGAGAELVLSGHIHQAAVYERHEFEVLEDGGTTTVLAVAPGLGRPRPRRLGEARGVHVHEIDGDAIVVRTHLWTRGEFALAAERRFLRR
ncbi:MAG TPA: metallophosphoesterase [Gaiellaceae bacterium]